MATHKLLDILPTRNKEEVTEWLKKHPHIQVVSRDGSKTYKKAILAANPEISQVSDRWHILKHLFDAVRKALFDVLPSRWKPANSEIEFSNKSLGPAGPLRKTEQVRRQNEEEKWIKIQEVHHMNNQGYSITSIARVLHLSRNTVYRYLEMKNKPSNRRWSRYDRFRPLIQSLVQQEQSTEQIEIACRKKSYQGSLGTLNTMIAEERRRQRTSCPPALYLRQKVLFLLWSPAEEHPEQQLVDLHPLFSQAFPQVFNLYQMIHSFRKLLIEKEPKRLTEWINRYSETEFAPVQSFVSSLLQDLPAILNSVKEPWSNGLAEGHVNRLKLIKRTMYGRAHFQLLRNKLLLSQL